MSGKLILIVGPSGSGKHVLTEHIRGVFPQLVFPVSCVTRPPRPGEREGYAYYFIARDEFQRRLEHGDFLETDEHFGNLYGTLKSEVEDPLREGKIVFRENEIHGVEQIERAIPRDQLTLIYVDAGSWEELEERVKARAPVSEEELRSRKERYIEEVKFREKADFVVSNPAGKLGEAKRQLEGVVSQVLEEYNRLGRPLSVIFMGPQGSGKGTQLALLSEFLKKRGEKVLAVETGKAFRVFMEGINYTHELVREGLARGERQPEFLATLLWGSSFVDQITNGDHILMDGFPRTILETQILDTAMGFYHRYPVHIVFLELSEEKAVERLLKRGRHDDTEGAIKERLRWYREEVAPIAEYYKKAPGYLVHSIDGDQEIEQVHREILSALHIA